MSNLRNSKYRLDELFFPLLLFLKHLQRTHYVSDTLSFLPPTVSNLISCVHLPSLPYSQCLFSVGFVSLREEGRKAPVFGWNTQFSPQGITAPISVCVVGQTLAVFERIAWQARLIALLDSSTCICFCFFSEACVCSPAL